jgi:hypothetical protein
VGVARATPVPPLGADREAIMAARRPEKPLRPHCRDEEIMDFDDATIIEERSRRRVADPSVPRRSPPRGVGPSLHAATVILASMLPPRGGFIMVVATTAMETGGNGGV